MAILVFGIAIAFVPSATAYAPTATASKHVAPSDGWTLVYDGRGVKANPDLREYVWQKTPVTLPNGPYDRIGLHRLVKAGTETQGVLFILPGTWSSGEQLISNPPEDTYTKDERNSEALYWADRGFDVYAIDYRTHFVPIGLSSGQLSFMTNWGWDQWIGDIKEAVSKVKAVSGAERIYMAGESFGGTAAMNYASLYWNKDLKGLIILDGAGTGTKNPSPTNSYNLPAAINIMNTTGAWSQEVSGPGVIFVFKYADAHPGAPAQFPPGTPLPPVINPLTGQPFANITEWAAFVTYFGGPPWGTAGISNIYGGYGNATVDIHVLATFDRYWPTRLTLETAAISDWTNCPYVTRDFDEHYFEIDVPLLAFTSQYFGFRLFGPFRNGIANPDFTQTTLWGYGHLDVFNGVYCERDVSQPTYEWMTAHRMLVGFGGVRVDHKWNFGETTIFINATVIGFKVDGVRVAWRIIDHHACKSSEFYEGQSELGWIHVLLTTRCSIANGHRVFFHGETV